jgi:hypothetical protein
MKEVKIAMATAMAAVADSAAAFLIGVVFEYATLASDHLIFAIRA